MKQPSNPTQTAEAAKIARVKALRVEIIDYLKTLDKGDQA